MYHNISYMFNNRGTGLRNNGIKSINNWSTARKILYYRGMKEEQKNNYKTAKVQIL